VLTEYTLAAPGEKPGWVAADDHGAVWFSDQGDTSVGRLDPSGTVTRYPLPAGRTPGSITVAADGSVWFVTTGPAVAHLTRSGEVVGYAVPPVPTPKWGMTDSEPTSLTTGPDGAVWYVNMGGDAVGRVDPAGHVSHYPLPSADRMHVNPEGIAAGADGAMWVSETLAMRVARVDVSTFHIAEYPVPPVPAGVPPAGMTAGPDGALWFDGPMGSALGRMTTGGEFRAYALPWQGQYAPTSATAGPDRRIWTVDTRNGKVLRTTVDGQTSEAPPVADPKALYEGGLRQLTAGPDAVWLTEAALNRIGRYACGTSRPGGVG
jgi:virginiamycin B lyase